MLRKLTALLSWFMTSSECPRHPGHEVDEVIVGSYPTEETWCAECFRESQEGE